MWGPAVCPRTHRCNKKEKQGALSSNQFISLKFHVCLTGKPPECWHRPSRLICIDRHLQRPWPTSDLCINVHDCCVCILCNKTHHQVALTSALYDRTDTSFCFHLEVLRKSCLFVPNTAWQMQLSGPPSQVLIGVSKFAFAMLCLANIVLTVFLEVQDEQKLGSGLVGFKTGALGTMNMWKFASWRVA